jgi:hypothetical protein
MEASGQLHAPSGSSSGLKLPVLIDRKLGGPQIRSGLALTYLTLIWNIFRLAKIYENILKN